eukprot:gene22483-28636_t
MGAGAALRGAEPVPMRHSCRRPHPMEKIALITGASRGIGAATARLAAKHGWAVAVNYLANEAAAQSVVDAIRASGGTASAVQ